MQYVFLGALVFPLFMLFDFVALRGSSRLKKATFLVGGIAFIGGTYGAVRAGPPFSIPPPLPFVGLVMTVVFAILLLYSLLIEIPFTMTYLSPGAPSQLVNTGTYALARHPGIIWMAFFLIGMVLASRSVTFVVAALVWLPLDVVHVWLQDRYIFPRQFPAYRAYQQETPMLWPTRASLRRCLQTLPWRSRASGD